MSVSLLTILTPLFCLPAHKQNLSESTLGDGCTYTILTSLTCRRYLSGVEIVLQNLFRKSPRRQCFTSCDVAVAFSEPSSRYATKTDDENLSLTRRRCPTGCGGSSAHAAKAWREKTLSSERKSQRGANGHAHHVNAGSCTVGRSVVRDRRRGDCDEMRPSGERYEKGPV